ATGPAAAEVACSPAGRCASDLRPGAVPEGLAPPDPAGVGGAPLWGLLGAGAAGLFALEWLLYQRRWLGGRTSTQYAGPSTQSGRPGRGRCWGCSVAMLGNWGARAQGAQPPRAAK